MAITNWTRVDGAIALDDHSARHESGGADEISLAGLLGLLAQYVEVSELGDATYDDVQDYINQFGNRTHITGMVISDNYDGTAAISSGTGWCKITDDLNADGKFFNFAGANTAALSELSINYIYLDYAGGTPALVVDTTGNLFYDFDHIILGCVFRHGTNLHIVNSNYAGLDAAHQTKMRFFEEAWGRRVSGLVTSSTGARYLVITSGDIWVGLTKLTTLSFNTITTTSGTATSTEAFYLNDTGASFTTNDVDKQLKNTTDTTYTDVVEFMSSTRLRVKDNIFTNNETYDLYDAWDEWFTANSGSSWSHNEGIRQINNTKYNDIASGLQTLSAASKRGVHWLYIDLEGAHLHMVYGQGDYTIAQAEAATVPSVLPPIITAFGILIAKIIVQKNQNPLIIAYPWTTAMPSSLAQDHGNLAGLTDDDHTQYIKNTEFTADSEILVGTGSGTFQKESGATLRTSIGSPSTAQASATALVWALVFGG